MSEDVLVVDDDVSLQRLLDRMLSSKGYTVHIASSAEEALRILRTQEIGVFFLDLQLPGIDGLELCRRLRESRPVTCIYAVTGYASLYDLEACRETGFDDYFTKPFEADDILKATRDGFQKIARWKKKSKEAESPA